MPAYSDVEVIYESILDGISEFDSSHSQSAFDGILRDIESNLGLATSRFERASVIASEFLDKNRGIDVFRFDVIENSFDELKRQIKSSEAIWRDAANNAERMKGFLRSIGAIAGPLSLYLDYEEIDSAVDSGDSGMLGEAFYKVFSIAAASIVIAASAAALVTLTGLTAAAASSAAITVLVASVPVIAVGLTAYFLDSFFESWGDSSPDAQLFLASTGDILFNFGNDVVDFARSAFENAEEWNLRIASIVDELPGVETIFSRIFDFSSISGELLGDNRSNLMGGSELQDQLFGVGGNDQLEGLGGNDLLYGDVGDDILEGGNDDDTLTGGQDNDTLSGGTGADTYRFNPGDGLDQIIDATHDAGDTILINADVSPINLSSYQFHILDGVAGGFGLYQAEHTDPNAPQVTAFFNGSGLMIDVAGGSAAGGNTIVVDHFVSGNFGIGLEAAELPETPSLSPSVYEVGTGILPPPEPGAPEPLFSRLYQGRLPGTSYLYDAAIYAGNIPGSDGYPYASVENPVATDRNPFRFDGGDNNDVLIGTQHSPVQEGGYKQDWLDGREGDDVIRGEMNTDVENGDDDYLMGGAGNDQIYGGGGNDTLVGWGHQVSFFVAPSTDQVLAVDWAGDLSEYQNPDDTDYLEGGYGADKLIGGLGNDTLIGGEGEDWLMAGLGDDIIMGGNDDDEIYADAYAMAFSNVQLGRYYIAPDLTVDYALRDSNRDIVDGGDGNDHILGGADNDIIYGGDGADEIHGDQLNDPLVTLITLDGVPESIENRDLRYADLDIQYHGDDQLYGGSGVDYIYGNGGNDSLFGGEGVDTLFGDDFVLDGAAHGDDYLAGDEGDDWLIGGGGTDILYGGADNDKLYGDHGDRPVEGYLEGLPFYGEREVEYRDQIFNYSVAAEFHGDDFLYGEAGADQLYGDGGNDWLDGGDDNDTLSGGLGEDVLYGGRGNDALNGGAGRDQYYFYQGDGIDTIIDFGDNDIIIAGSISAIIQNSSSLTEIVYGNGDRVLTSAKAASAIIANGERINIFDYLSAPPGVILQGTSGNDTLDTSRTGGTEFHLNGGDDTVNVDSSSSLIIDAGSGNDTLNIIASSGLVVDGGAGDDIYHIQSLGQGVTLAFNSSNYGSDQVVISDVSQENVLAGRVGNSLHLLTKNSGDADFDLDTTQRIILENFYSRTGLSGTVVFSGNNTVAFDTLASTPLILGTAGYDSLVGDDGDNVFIGGRSGDTLNAGAGSDTFVYNLGDGDDRILLDASDYASQDVIQFGEDITPDDVIVRRAESGYSADGTGDLRITLSDGGTIVVQDHFSEARPDLLDELQFSNGETLSSSQLRALALTPTDGDDVLVGSSTHDQMFGGLGNDRLVGASGNDTYAYRLGDGNDTIVDTQGTGNRIVIQDVLSPDDVTWSSDQGDLLLQFSDGGSIRVADYFDYYAGGLDAPYIAQIEFVDASVILDQQQVLNRIFGNVITGTTGDDTLIGDNNNNYILAGGGADTIDTQGGDDVIDATNGGALTLKFGYGYGINKIINSYPDINPLVIEFDDPAINIDDLTVEYLWVNTEDRAYSEDYRLSISLEDGSSLLFTNGYEYVGGLPAEFHFADGSVWRVMTQFNDQALLVNDEGLAEIPILQRGSAGNDFIAPWNVMAYYLDTGSGDDLVIDAAYGHSDIIWGGPGDDAIFGAMENDVIDGGSGNDILHGGYWSDTLRGGPGDDYLQGADSLGRSPYMPNNAAMGLYPSYDVPVDNGYGFGDDVYQYATGDGRDTINNIRLLSAPSASEGRISMLAGVDRQAVVLFNHLGDLVVRFTNNPDDQVRVLNHFDAATAYNGNWVSYALNTIEFADGTTWTNSDIANRAITTGIYGDQDEQVIGASAVSVIQVADLLANDISVADTALSVTGVTNAQGGEAVLDAAAGTITFTRDTSNSGPYGFDYTVSDGSNSSVGTVSLTVDPNAGLNEIQGTSGADTLNGTIGADLISAGAGNDTVFGDAGNDTLIGGTGDDMLNGGLGNDTYFYNLGDGTDIINSLDITAGKVDVLSFGSGIVESDIQLSRYLNYLILNVQNGAGMVAITNFLQDDGAAGYQLEEIRFADGAVWTLDDIKTRLLAGTDGNDWLRGYASDDVISSGAGNDTLYGFGGADALDGGTGNDTLHGGTGNDMLNGGLGNDTYVYNLGDGQDIINSLDTTAGKVDVLSFGSGIVESDIQLSRYLNYLIVNVQNGSGMVAITNFLQDDATAGYQLEEIRFADGAVWTLDDIKTRLLAGTDGNDWRYGYASDDVIASGAGNDTLYGYGGNDTLDGGTGNDTLHGGTGDDTLNGGLGNDTYVYNLGDGHDFINSLDTTAGKMDVLSFGSGIVESDIQFLRYLSSVVISVQNWSGSVSIASFLQDDATAGYQLEEIRFADGAVWTLDDIKTRLLAGTDGNDVLVGFASDDVISSGAGNDILVGNGGGDMLEGETGNDTLNGGAGNDALNGGDGSDILIGGTGNDFLYGDFGNDTYVYTLGDGSDSLDNFSTLSQADTETDVLKLEGLAAESVWLTQSEADLLIEFVGEAGSIMLHGFYLDESIQMDEISAGNKVLYASEVQQLVDAMAAFTDTSGIVGDGGVAPVDENLSTALAAAWQPAA